MQRTDSGGDGIGSLTHAASSTSAVGLSYAASSASGVLLARHDTDASWVKVDSDLKAMIE